MSWRGHMGSMGWPGGNVNTFPKWAIDIIQFRNKKLNDDYKTSGYKFEDVEKEYKEIDSALNELCKFIGFYYITDEHYLNDKRKKSLDEII